MKDKSILMRTVVAIIILLFAHTVLAEFKEWTTIDNQTLVWELIAVDGEFATFRTRDGIKLEFHASRLSADSRRAVREWIDERKRQEEARRIIHALETEYGHTDASKIFSSAEIWEWADSQSARINALLDSTEPGEIHIALLEFKNRLQPTPSKRVSDWERIETPPSPSHVEQQPIGGHLVGAIIVGAITVIIAIGLKKLIDHKGPRLKRTHFARRWAAWAVFLATLSALLQAATHDPVEALILWPFLCLAYGLFAFLIRLVFPCKPDVIDAESELFSGPEQTVRNPSQK